MMLAKEFKVSGDSD